MWCLLRKNAVFSFSIPLLCLVNLLLVDLIVFKSYWSHLLHLSQNGLQRNIGILKQSEIWQSGLLVEYMWETFDLVMFNVILGDIQCT